MGRTGHPALILGTTALLVVAVGTGVALTRNAVPIAKAATTLASVVDANLVASDGQVTAAHSGQRVPNGDVVRTGPHGSAKLITRGRVVYLDQSAAVAVIDGAHQQLRTGSAVIDAQHGPALRLDIADDVLAVQAGSATEAIRSVSVAVGSLAGAAQLTSATGRQLSVPALAQTVVSGDALPNATTPLHLTGNPAEAVVVPTLVSDNAALQTLADGINASSRSTVRVLETGWTGVPAALPAAAPRSEQVLPVVIADSTNSAGGTNQDRYDHVITWRSQGGSWGVVAALLKTHAAAVEATFASLQHGRSTPHSATSTIQALGAPGHFGGGGQPRSHPTSHPVTSPTSHPTPSHPGGGSTGGSPTPSPSSPGLINGLLGTVGGTLSAVVGTVLDLLPKPATATPTPRTTPSASASAPSLLGGLLGN